jgi:hypothetical protein
MVLRLDMRLAFYRLAHIESRIVTEFTELTPGFGILRLKHLAASRSPLR